MHARNNAAPGRAPLAAPDRDGFVAVRARAVLPLAGESPARGMRALAAPLARIDNCVITARDGVILAVEPYKDYMRRAGTPAPHTLLDLGDVLLTPGLVNCHTHLELSHMHGKTLTGKGFLPWLESLVALDRQAPSPDAGESLRAAVAALLASGSVLAGDISSRIPREVLEVTRDQGLAARIFLEVIGHDPELPERYAAQAESDPAFSLAGHALYTTPGESAERARAWCAAHGRPFSMHLAEHEDEETCLLSGRGAFHDMLCERVLPQGWRAPGMRPVRYAASLGLLAPETLAVHCVRCDAKDIDLLAASGAAVCLCPRSNALIGVGEAPARAMAEKGILLCLGTDSLASNTDLRLWNEADFFLKKNVLPANALLRMATINGAAVLGSLRHFGTLERGKRFCYTVFPSEMNTLFRQGWSPEHTM